MSRSIILAAALAATGCYDGPTSESSVFDCYCTHEIALMAQQAVDIAAANDEAVKADCEAFTSAEVERVIRDRADPAFYWLDSRILELEQRIRELEASAAYSSPDP